MTQIKEHKLGIFSGIILTTSITLGTGVLILPSLLFQSSGNCSIYAWIFNSILVIPLLIIFAHFGKKFPDAGGVSKFIELGFPRSYLSAALVLIFTFVIALPAIALTGVLYISELTKALFLVSAQSQLAIGLSGLLFFTMITFFSLQGLKNNMKMQIITMILLVFLLFSLFITLCFFKPVIITIEPVKYLNKDWGIIWHGMAIGFFAYSGWETVASMSNDFRNPTYDYPVAIIGSFILVSLIYLSLGLSIQMIHPDLSITQASILILVLAIFKSKLALLLSSVITIMVVFTNLNGLILGASRLIVDMSQRNLLPKIFQKETKKNKTPIYAIFLLYGLCFYVFLMYLLSILDIKTMIVFAGASCAFLYLICSISYFKIHNKVLQKVIASLSIFVCLLLSFAYNKMLLLPMMLFFLPYAVYGIISLIEQKSSRRVSA